MIAQLIILAAMTGQTFSIPTVQAQPQQQWVWITNQGRYGWGSIDANGYFVEAPSRPTTADKPTDNRRQPPTNTEPVAGATPNYGVDMLAVKQQQSTPFTTNDPEFMNLIEAHVPPAERQVPMPLSLPAKTSSTNLFTVIVVILALMLLLTIGINETRKVRG